MKKIQLTKGYFTIVDDEDFDFLMKFKWYVNDTSSTQYAETCIWIPYKKKTITIKMHRLIMNVPNHLVIDHINRNGLDNRKENLKICTRRENNINSLRRSKYGLTGVCKGWGNRYGAQIKKNGKYTHLGNYDTVLEAHQAYLRAINK